VEDVAIYIGASNMLTFARKQELLSVLIEHAVKQNLLDAYKQ